jgi:hypothetical protein
MHASPIPGLDINEEVDITASLDAILAEAAAAALAAEQVRGDDASAPRVLVKFVDHQAPDGIQWRPALLLGHYDDARARVLVLNTSRRFTCNVAASSVRLPDGNPLAAIQHVPQLPRLQLEHGAAAHNA